MSEDDEKHPPFEKSGVTREDEFMSDTKLQKWALIAEVIAAFAVVVSLIFVGFQVKQSAEETRLNAEATRAATVLQLKQSWVDLNLMMASTPELHRSWDRSIESGFENISYTDQQIIFAHWRVIMHTLSNAYYQYRIGTLEEEQWEPLFRDIEGSAKAPNFWETWDDWQHIFDDPFRELVNSKRPK